MVHRLAHGIGFLALGAFLAAGGCLDRPGPVQDVRARDAGPDGRMTDGDAASRGGEVAEVKSSDAPLLDCKDSCGEDGCVGDDCGGPCGTCGENEKCLASGQCGTFCEWVCESRSMECGLTGEPESCYCGDCSQGSVCVQSHCVAGALACGDVACPGLAGYFVSCNSKVRCEYASSEATGFKKWDVWVYVPPGTFSMGCPPEPLAPETCSESGLGPSDELPLHEVTIDDGYFISKYEIVVEQYEACVADFGKCTPADASAAPMTQGTNRSEDGKQSHPQNGLTWQQATEFCDWVAPNGRLPSEAEWEYAATGPVHQEYPWGDNPAPTCANDTAVFNAAGGEGGYGCGSGGTSPVGSKPAGDSWSGALDMAGNLWEWCLDSYHDSYSGAPGNGGPWMGSDSKRVIRGGSFGSMAAGMRSAERDYVTPSAGVADVGARCVRP